jgi:hypothetical protein
MLPHTSVCLGSPRTRLSVGMSNASFTCVTDGPSICRCTPCQRISSSFAAARSLVLGYLVRE